jgi:hypothetical protein
MPTQKQKQKPRAQVESPRPLVKRVLIGAVLIVALGLVVWFVRWLTTLPDNRPLDQRFRPTPPAKNPYGFRA